MSMHLMKIRVVEKSKSKKWTSAEAKAKAAELEESWDKLKSKYEQPTKKPSLQAAKQMDKGMSHLYGFKPPRGASVKIQSKDDGVGIAAKKDVNMYTGENVLGISIVHKSCLQPVFSEEQAKDFANMRR